jgi:hypothetical protein
LHVGPLDAKSTTTEYGRAHISQLPYLHLHFTRRVEGHRGSWHETEHGSERNIDDVSHVRV